MQSNYGFIHRPDDMATDQGQEACVQALLRAGANTELLDKYGRTALQWAEIKGQLLFRESRLAVRRRNGDAGR